ncbi:uncharacterized protein LOC123921820 isoform X1 [Trifolium pratense]|uniref:uncharacterized protein LOC123921820 isoform X1 n=2 Tax=Trifolium pratense TaxID=57577 RepID=UPI001E697A5F|nr:uncharacterized protein LOC123921820 isoform X1 [Trifolium pratense]XP_045830471.1 uncharacterized protein LOC123921820 isoform X1 [Trifolium pratense]XP_045830477.1 uncharacterized protein LOC123921820 isoform X1 [Trifolium pratense]XP_045830485.1 uncharacterized protein LOC123921820 isoform X1 [Trifolium pratense]
MLLAPSFIWLHGRIRLLQTSTFLQASQIWWWQAEEDSNPGISCYCKLIMPQQHQRMTEPASNVASCSGTAMEKSSKGYFRNIHTSHQFLLYHFKKIFIFWIQSIMLPRISASNFDVKRCTDNTCNGFYCDYFSPNTAYKPKMWTEAWTGWFTEFGGPVPHRPAEDLAFSIARFMQKGDHLSITTWIA